MVVTAACLVASGTATASAAEKPAPKHKSKPGPVVVVSGLNNPRQLSLVNGNVLLVAEAGKGGTVATAPNPDGGPAQGLGYTGSISAVLAPSVVHGQQPHRIVTGLLSAAQATADANGPAGSGAIGPDGVSAKSLSDIAIIETTFGPATPAAAKKFDGQLLRTRPYSRPKAFANITGFEVKYDPDKMGVDSDPYAVLNYNGGWLVADAAGNDVLWVNRDRHISVFAKFHNVTVGACAGQQDPPGFPGCNFVPTSLATDRWGNVYVGGLSSLTPGAAQVVKLDRHGHRLATWNGFTAVTGLAVGRDGSIYVSQLFATEANPALPIIQGVLTKVSGNHRTNVDVPFPAGIALDSCGNVYVSAFSILPDTGAGIPGVDTSGQVWRLRT
ncbi:MAG TPA: ScyD/ScyE family protein [Jatrophihabitans sp.]